MATSTEKSTKSVLDSTVATTNPRAATAREMDSIKIDTAAPFNVTGSASDLLNPVGGLTTANADRAGTITVTGWATAAQARTLQLWADGNTRVSYNIQDTASSLASLKSGVTGFVLNINATTTATIAEANTLAAFKNSGTTAFEVSGTATALLGKTSGLSDLAGQKAATILVNGTATAVQASQFIRWLDADTTISYSLRDTADNLATASSTVLGQAQTITASNLVSVQQAQTVSLAALGKTFVFNLQDTASQLARMDAALAASATALSATTVATVTEANAIAAFTNKGSTAFDVSGTAGELLDFRTGLDANAAEKADQIEVTGEVTARQASALQAWNDDDTLVSFSIRDDVDALSRLSAEAGDAATDIKVEGAANVDQANRIAAFSNAGETGFSVGDTAKNLTDSSAGLSAAAQVEADRIRATDSATVEQATLIRGWADSDTVVEYSITDTPTQLAAASKAVTAAATDVTATGVSSIAEANAIANFTNSGETFFTVEGTAADLIRIRTGLSSKAASKADQIIVTGTATVSQASKIQAWADDDTQVVYDLADQPDLLADAAAPVLTGAKTVTVADVATVEQITALAATLNLASIRYDLVDAPLSLVDAGADILAGAVNLTVTSPASAADALVVTAAGNSGVITYSLSDSPEELALLAKSIGDGAIDVVVTGRASAEQANLIADWDNSGVTQLEVEATARELTDPFSGLSMRAASLARLIQTTGTASVFQATQIESWSDVDTTVVFSLEDSADALANASRTVLQGATGITASDAATVARAAVIAAAGNSGTTRYNLEDSSANLVAADAAILNGATDIKASGQTSVKAAVVLEAATNSGTLAYHLNDTASALAAAGEVILNGAGDVVATDAATAAQAILLQAASNSGETRYDLRDTATALAGLSPVVGSAARDITVTDEATATEANTITAFANSGSIRFEVADAAAALTSKAEGLRALAAEVALDITVTDAATVQQATTVVGWLDEDTTVRYSLKDGATALAKADPAVGDQAIDVVATDTATVPEANTIAAFLNTGSTVFSVTGKASDLTAIATLGTDRAARRLAESGAGLAEAAAEDAAEITATGTATVAQATRLQSWADNDTAVIYSIKDTAARLIPADAAVVVAAREITVSDQATVRGISAILANGVADRISYSLTDTASNLAAADAAVLNRATNIQATGTATVEEARILEAATQSGTLTYHLEDTPAALAAAGDVILNGAGDLAATDAATAAQAVVLEAASNSGKTRYDIQDTAVALAGLNPAVGNAARDIAVTDKATTAEANAIAALANSGSLRFEVADVAATLTGLTSGLKESAAEKALRITVTDTATVAQAGQVQQWADDDTTVRYSLKDAAAALAKADPAVANQATDIAVTDTVSVVQANTLAGFTNPGNTAFNVAGTAADLTDLTSGLNQAASSEADLITATDAATVQQATRIKGWADLDTRVSYSLRDTISQIVTAAPAVLNGANGITISDGAQVKDIAGLQLAISNPNLGYSLADTAAALATTSKAIGDGALDINVQGTANTSEANAIAAFKNRGTVSLAVSDTPSNLTGIGNTTTLTFDFYRIDSWDNETFQIYNGKNLVLSQTFQWGTNVTVPLSGKGVNSTWSMIPTTAGNVNQAFSGWSDQKFSVTLTLPIVNSLNLRLTSTLNQDVNDESWGIDNFKVSLGSKVVSLEDFATSTGVSGWSTGKFTNTWGGFLGRYSVNESVSKTIKLTGLSSSDVDGLSTATLGKAGIITATEAATAEQATRLQSWNTDKTTVNYSIVDSVSNLAATAPAVLNAATDLTATGDATVLQATALDAATNSGITLYNLSDTAPNLAAVAETAILNSARDIVASGNATVQEATLIEAATNSGLTRYSVSDNVTALVGMAPAAGNVALNITATDTAVVAQANTIAGFSNTGTTAFNVGDTAAALTDEKSGLTATAAGEADLISVTGTALVGEASRISGWADADTKVSYSISDTAGQLAGASTATLNRAVDITATDAATVSQATLIEAASNTGITRYNLQDTPAALILASKAVGDGATDIVATATASIAEANTIAAFNNKGDTAFNVAGTAKALTDSASLAPVTTISFDFYRIDSWDAEQFQVYAGKDLILNQAFSHGSNVTAALSGKGVNSTWTMTPTTAGNANQAFSGWSDQKFAVTITLPSTTTLNLRMTSTLNQDVNDESWGIDNLKISSANGVISNEDFPRASAVTDWNTGKFDSAWGGFLGRYGSGQTAAKSFTNPAANVGLSAQAIKEADTITVTDTATVSEARKIQAWDSVDTLVVYSIRDTAGAIAAADGKVLNGAVNITATGNATASQAATILAASNSGTTTYNLGDTSASLALADPAVLSGATDITVTGSTSVRDLGLIRAATNSSNVYYSLSDTASQLAGAPAGLLNSATDITAPGAATVAEAAAIDAAFNKGTTSYSITDKAAALTAAPLNLLNGATDIQATDPLSAAQGVYVESATNKGKTVYSLTDTATNLAQVSTQVLDGALDISVTDKATASQAGIIDAANNTGKTAYSVEDTASALATLRSTTGSNALNLIATTTANTAQANTIASFTNGGQVSFKVADTGSALLDGGKGLSTVAAEEADNIQATGTVTVTEATRLLGWADEDTTVQFELGDKATSLAAAAPSLIGQSPAITVTSDARVTEANAMAAFGKVNWVTFPVADTLQALTDATQGLSAEAAEIARTINGTGAATVAQVSQVLAWGDEDTTVSLGYDLTDTAAHLAGADTKLLNGAINITATDPITVAQATTLEQALNSGKFSYSLTDSPEALAAASQSVLNGATDITANAPLNVAQTFILGRISNSGIQTYEVEDTASALAQATVAQREVQDTGTLTWFSLFNRTFSFYGDGTHEYDVIINSGPTGFGSVAAMATAFQSHANYARLPYTVSLNPAGDGLRLTFKTGGDFAPRTLEIWGDYGKPLQTVTDGTNIAIEFGRLAGAAGTVVASTPATVAEANILAALSSKEGVRFEVSDTAAALLNETGGLGSEAIERAGRITVTGAVTLSQAERLLAWGDEDTVLNYDLSGDAASLSGAAAATLKGATNIVITGTATVAQVNLIGAVGHSGALSYSLDDTVSALTQAKPELLDGATHITASGTANLEQAQALLAARNAGDTTLEAASLKAEDAISLEYDTTGNDTLRSLTVTGVANVAEASILLEDKAAGNLLNLTYGITDSIENVVAASQEVITGASSLVIVEGLADYGFNTDQTLPLGSSANISDKLRAVDMTSIAGDGQDMLITANGHTLRVLDKNQLDGTELLFADGSLLKMGGLTGDIINGGNTIDTGDYLLGGGGNDKIRGLSGEDKLYGGSGSDILYGGKGRDTLSGGLDNDLLYGGSGSGDDGSVADHFVYQYGVNEGRDIIVSFDTVQDKLVIQGGGHYSRAVYSVTTSGNGTVVTLKQPDGTPGTLITLMGVSDAGFSVDGNFLYTT